MFRTLNWFRQATEAQTPVIAEYIWIDGDGIHLRSKSRTLDVKEVKELKDIPDWTYDGSSTNQASVDRSELVLKPVFYCRDPFRGEKGINNAILVLCSAWKWSFASEEEVKTGQLNGLNQASLESQYLQPAVANFRHISEPLWTYVEDEEIQFGIEQEYLIEDPNIEYFNSQMQKPQYCAQGEQMRSGRKISETHYQNCLYAGLSIHGTNSEVLFNQWEYQIGVCDGIEVADQLWMSRYILYRVAEQFGVDVNLNPKPYFEENGSGAHVNFSTAKTRLEARKAVAQLTNNLSPIIQQMINDLGETHSEYIKYYGKNNQSRLTGENETSNYDSFSYGLDSRNVSLRIPTKPVKTGEGSFRVIQGYIEDRRPAANMDPYVVCALIAQSVLAPTVKQIVKEITNTYDNSMF